MKKYLDLLKKVSLFANINQNDFEAMLKCLGAFQKKYDSGNIIILKGSEVDSIGIILKGTIQIVREDLMGNKTIVSEFGEGEIFGETFACAGVKKSLVTVVAASDTEVLYIKFKKVLNTCSSMCKFHMQLIENMLMLIAKKNLYLMNKIELLSCRSIREKLTLYFENQVERVGKTKFEIPFSREELADFLSINRSAMSRELCKMRDEGIIRFDHNRFEFLGG